MAEWQFPVYPADLVEQDPTQRDQFNNDEVGLAGALVREVIQNSSDAANNQGPVKVRFARLVLNGIDTGALRALFPSLVPHLEACGMSFAALQEQAAELLVVEDFNTHGLTGAVDQLDEGNFRNFWRRHGKSGKGGKSGGRWGLGKLVYSSSSRLGAFFGLTVRAGDAGPLLMGQAVLTTHAFDGERRPPHGFWFKDKASGLQLPLSDPVAVESFAQLAGFTRSTETGLSIAIPYPAASITEQALIQGVVENYYFPILAGQLVVEVGDTIIDKDTFLQIAGAASLQVPFGFVAGCKRAARRGAGRREQGAGDRGGHHRGPFFRMSWCRCARSLPRVSLCTSGSRSPCAPWSARAQVASWSRPSTSFSRIRRRPVNHIRCSSGGHSRFQGSGAISATFRPMAR